MLYKRKGSSFWWIKIQINGQTIYRSTKTESKKEAEQYHDKLKNSLWQQDKLGAKPKYKWEEAVIRFINETKHKATQHDDLMHLRWLDIHLRGRTLDSINRSDLDQITTQRTSEGVTNATVNRTLAVVRSILRKACNEWEWIDRHPKIKLLSEPKRRVRWLTHEEATRLLAELPKHLNAMARFTLETGLRQANVSGLKWDQVDIDRKCAWIHPDQAKARKAIPVPLSPAAIEIVLEQRGNNKEFIFTYENKKITNVSTRAWRKALIRAGIEDFRWHDLRHTWASWMVQKGCPLNVLQELGGWSDYKMVQRYAHFNADHLAEYVNNLHIKQ